MVSNYVSAYFHNSFVFRLAQHFTVFSYVMHYMNCSEIISGVSFLGFLRKTMPIALMLHSMREPYVLTCMYL